MYTIRPQVTVVSQRSTRTHVATTGRVHVMPATTVPVRIKKPVKPVPGRWPASPFNWPY